MRQSLRRKQRAARKRLRANQEVQCRRPEVCPECRGSQVHSFGRIGRKVVAELAVQEMNLRDSRRWPQEAALRQQLRGRFFALSEVVAAVARSTVRASSVVENLNSRLRNYCFLRRQLGPD